MAWFGYKVPHSLALERERGGEVPAWVYQGFWYYVPPWTDLLRKLAAGDRDITLTADGRLRIGAFLMLHRS
jgi:hypothetical protein